MQLHPILRNQKTTELHAVPVESTLALKLACDQTRDGELEMRFRDAESEPAGLLPVPTGPSWLTESVVDDTIWSSHRALHWLSDGKCVSAVRQPQLGPDSHYKTPDYAFVGDTVRIVELEKDGRGVGGTQLLEQLDMAYKLKTLRADEEVELLALDTRKTNTWQAPASPHVSLHSRCWHLAYRPEAPSARWIVLTHEAELRYTPQGRQREKWEAVRIDDAEFAISVRTGEAMLREQVGVVKIVKVAFRTGTEAKLAPELAFFEPGQMMGRGPRWLKELGVYLWRNQAKEGGCLGWRLFDSTGRGNSANITSLLLYFRVETDVAASLTGALLNFQAAGHLKHWRAEAELARKRERRQKRDAPRVSAV